MAGKTRTGVVVSAFAAIVNLILAFGKLFIGLASNSVGIITDGINNFGDVITLSGGALGLALSKKEPTEKFPRGFKKAEALTALFIAEIIVIVGCAFAYMSVERLIFRRPVFFSVLYAAIIAATVVIKLVLFAVLHFADKKAPSEIIKCQKADCLMDAGITSVTLIGYVTASKIGFPIDALVGIAVASAILIFGLKTVKNNAVKLLV